MKFTAFFKSEKAALIRENPSLIALEVNALMISN